VEYFVHNWEGYDMSRRVRTIFVFSLMATLFGTGPAWAYLDPGTGSMMLQLLLGGVAGVMVVGRLYWQRFREFVTSRFSGKPDERAPARRAGTSARTDSCRTGRGS
jgi:hypothetical protein